MACLPAARMPTVPSALEAEPPTQVRALLSKAIFADENPIWRLKLVARFAEIPDYFVRALPFTCFSQNSRNSEREVLLKPSANFGPLIVDLGLPALRCA